MKKILTHLRTDWYKYALELIVITAGIIGAFALNSWKQEQVERNQEIDYIHRLMVELKMDTTNLFVEYERAVKKYAFAKEVYSFIREDTYNI